MHGATFFKYLTVLGYLFQYLILGFPGSFPLFGAKNKTQSQLSCRLNFSLNCSLVFPIYLPSVPFSQEHQAFLVIAWVSGLPKWLGERRFEMGEGGGGEALSFFRFHLSPFPQKRLILRLFLSFLHSFSSHKFYYLLVLVTYSNVHSLISILFFFFRFFMNVSPKELECFVK